MSVQNDHRPSPLRAEDAWVDHGSDFVLIEEGKPPPRIELACERLLICRLYLGLLRTITDDYGAEFASHSDNSAKDARPVIAEAALQYARMLIASALSKRGNADRECPASI
jgi:hypothetical protein